MTRQRGFTLLELMVVLVIVAILAALAVSSYKEQVRKSRRTEAYNLVGQMQLQLERWRAENPCYGPIGNSGGCPAPTFTASGTYPAIPTTSSYYTIAVPPANATATSYSITATRKSTTDQANDRCLDLSATGTAKPIWGNTACN
jgi:type IV pilus assembly protein PilE